MANIRKSFNFKNGVQVDNQNFVVNANGLVGIGTTIPRDTLDVRGDARVSGLVTSTDVHTRDLLVTGVATVTSITDGTITIQSGVITSTSGIVTYYGDGSGLVNIPTSQWVDIDVGLGYTSIYARAGNVGVGTQDPRFSFQIGGQPGVLGHEGVGISSLTGDIISTGIVSATTLQGAYGASELTGTIDNARLPNNINKPTGTFTASSFVGVLTGNADTASNLSGTPDINVGIVSATDVRTTRLDVSGVGTVATLTATNSVQVGSAGTAFKALSSGKLGIGTELPGEDITVRKPSGAAIEVVSDTGEAKISIGQSVNQGNQTAVIRYGNQADTLDILNRSTGNIRSVLDFNGGGINTGGFTWHHANTANTLMTLTYEGNLGINDTAPTERLTVGGGITVSDSSHFGSNLTVSGFVTATRYFGDGSNLTGIALQDPANIRINSPTGVSTVGQLHVIDISTDLQGIASIGINTNDPVAGLDARTVGGLFNGIGINTDRNATDGRGLEVYGRDVFIKGGNLRLEQGTNLLGQASNGSIGIGTSMPRAVIDMGNAADLNNPVSAGFSGACFILPTVTIAQRDAIRDQGAPFGVPGIGGTVVGSFIYNSDSDAFQGYTGVGWTSLGVPPTGAYTDGDVDVHLNVASAGAGEVLSWTGSDYDWIASGTIAGIDTTGTSFFNIINATDVNVSGVVTAGIATIRTLRVGPGDTPVPPDGQLAIVNTNGVAALTLGQNVDGTGQNHLGFYYNGGGAAVPAHIFTSNGDLRFVVDGGGGGGVPLVQQAGFQFGVNGNFTGQPLVEIHSVDPATGINTALVVNGDARITGVVTVGTDSVTIDGTNNEIRIGTGVTLTSTGQAEYSGIVTASGFVGDTSDAVAGKWTLGADGTSNYTFTGPGLIGAENDPTIYVQRGMRYEFVNNMGAHPFRIQTTENGAAGPVYNEGVTNNNVSNGTLEWHVQFDAPDTLYYQCTSHNDMGGRIVVGGGGGTGGGGTTKWLSTSVGIHTLSNVGVGTTNPVTPLQVGDVYGVTSGIGTFVAVAGVSTNIDSFTINTNNFLTAEYTVHFTNSAGTQVSKALAMQNGTTADSQEYAIMFNNSLLVSVGSSVHSGDFNLNVTPQAGVSGLTTYRFTRQTML